MKYGPFETTRGAQVWTVPSNMISIMKYLRDRPSDSETALRRTVSLLLQLIEIHAIEGDAVDYAQFRSGIHEIASRLSENTRAQDILVISGEVATTLKEYAERTTRFVKAQSAEYQRMLTMLTETIAATSQASDRTVNRLRDVERKLEKAVVLEDVRLLRMQLHECLGSIREEIQSQQLLAADPSKCIQPPTGSEGVQPVLAPVMEADPITGLPGRVLAESALQNAFSKGGPYWAAVVVVDRIASVNSRFGYAVGDRLLRKVSRELQSGLSAEDQVFRWNGPALMALLLRTKTELEMKRELSRIASVQAEEVVEIGSRSILLPVSTNWALFPVNAPARVIRDKADQFVASQTTRS